MQIDNNAVFPQQFGCPFPPNFMDVTKTIFKRLFRVYAHIYHSHFKQVRLRDCLSQILSLTVCWTGGLTDFVFTHAGV